MKPLEWQSPGGRRFRGRIMNKLITYSMIQFLLWPLQCQCRDAGKWRQTKNGHERELVKENNNPKACFLVGGMWGGWWRAKVRHAKAAAHVTRHCKTTCVRFEVQGPTNRQALSRQASQWGGNTDFGRCRAKGCKQGSLSSSQTTRLIKRVKVIFISGLGWCSVVVLEIGLGLQATFKESCFRMDGLGIFD